MGYRLLFSGMAAALGHFQAAVFNSLHDDQHDQINATKAALAAQVEEIEAEENARIDAKIEERWNAFVASTGLDNLVKREELVALTNRVADNEVDTQDGFQAVSEAIAKMLPPDGATAETPPADPGPPPPDTGATAVISTDPAHGAVPPSSPSSGDGQPVIITQAPAAPDGTPGPVLITPVVSGTVPAGSVTVDPDTGTPSVDPAAIPPIDQPPVLGATVPAPDGTPPPDSGEHTANGDVADVSAPAAPATEDPPAAAADGGGDPQPPAAAAPEPEPAPEPGTEDPQPASADPAPPAAVLSTDPAHGATDDAPVIVTADPAAPADAPAALITPVVSGDVPAASVTVDDQGTPAVAAPTDGSPPVVLGETVPAPDGTPLPDDPAHVDNPAVATDVAAPADPAAG